MLRGKASCIRLSALGRKHSPIKYRILAYLNAKFFLDLGSHDRNTSVSGTCPYSWSQIFPVLSLVLGLSNSQPLMASPKTPRKWHVFMPVSSISTVFSLSAIFLCLCNLFPSSSFSCQKLLIQGLRLSLAINFAVCSSCFAPPVLLRCCSS